MVYGDVYDISDFERSVGFDSLRTQPRVSRSPSPASTGSTGSSEVRFISSSSWGESKLLPGVSSPSLGPVRAAGSEP